MYYNFIMQYYTEVTTSVLQKCYKNVTLKSLISGWKIEDKK